MGWFDVLKSVFGAVAPLAEGALSAGKDVRPHELPQDPYRSPAPGAQPPPTPFSPPPALPPPAQLPDRTGSFIVTDLYPLDVGGKPDWAVLRDNWRVGPYEVVGSYLKATEGTAYPYTTWYVDQARKIRAAYGSRYGFDRHAGAYHFVQLAADPVKQAEFFVSTVQSAGPYGVGDLVPWVDFEQGGQNGFFPPGCPQDLSTLQSSMKRALASKALACTHAFSDRVKQLTGWRLMLYGRGLQRDLGMTLANGYSLVELRMGCDVAVNPAYTMHMPPMDDYGWPIDDVPFWQAGGDGTSNLPGFPHTIPGFGSTDMSVHVDGKRQTTLSSFRKRCVL